MIGVSVQQCIHGNEILRVVVSRICRKNTFIYLCLLEMFRFFRTHCITFFYDKLYNCNKFINDLTEIRSMQHLNKRNASGRQRRRSQDDN